MTIKLQTEQHLEVLGLRGGCIGSSESTIVKVSHCYWISHVIAHVHNVTGIIPECYKNTLLSPDEVGGI